MPLPGRLFLHSISYVGLLVEDIAPAEGKRGKMKARADSGARMIPSRSTQKSLRNL